MNTKVKAALVILLGLIVTSPVYAAGTLVAKGRFGGQLSIESQDVRVTVNNGIAVTEVTQIFVNEENRVVEALYTFPVPKNASVSNFSMWIKGKEMIGEVLEKKRAREIYETYKKTNVDPGLLEQVNYKTFEMRIYPIAAKAKQKIRLTYYQELDIDHDRGTFVYPLATNTEGFTSTKTTGRFSIDFNVKSAIPVTELSSSSHNNDFVYVQHTPTYWQASLEIKEGDLNRDVVLSYALERPKTGFDIITSKTDREDGYFYMTLSVGKELKKINEGMDYVFLLDISGSMKQQQKLGTSCDSIDAFVKELEPQDNFEVIAFNVGANPLFGKLQQANDANQNKATSFLGKAQAKGGTDLRPAVQKAYQYHNIDRQLNVIILSDGMTEQRSTAELMQIIKERPGNTRVFCIGVGNEVNRPLLQDMAQKSGGLASFLSKGDNFKRQAAAFRRKLLRPAVSDIKINFSKDVYDLEPKEIPNLYHGTPIRIYGRYKNGGPVNISFDGNLQGRKFSQKMEVDFPDEDKDNPEIERMWAWHKVQRLLKEADRNGGRGPVIPEIVRLGEGYSIATEYTSFLVLENDSEYKRWKIDRKNALRIERDRESQQRLQNTLSKLRQGVDKNIGPADQPDVEEKKPVRKVQKTQNRNTSSPQQRPISRNFGGGGSYGPFALITALLLCLSGSLIRRKEK